MKHNPLYTYYEKKDIQTDFPAEEFRKQFFASFSEKLVNADVREIRISTDEIEFTAPIGRYTWNGWNIFNPVTSGKLKIVEFEDRPYLTYTTSYLEFLWIAIALSILPLVAFYSGIAIWGVLELILIWGVFYGGSRAVSAMRFATLLAEMTQEIIAPVPEKVEQKEPLEKPDRNEPINEDLDFFKKVFIERPAVITIG